MSIIYFQKVQHTEELEFVLFGLSSISTGSSSKQEHTVQDQLHSVQEVQAAATSTNVIQSRSIPYASLVSIVNVRKGFYR